MGFKVYREQLDDVRDEAIATLNENRKVPLPPERFDWLYRSNPDGEAILWSVRPHNGSEMAGFTVALPRRMIVDGHAMRCWNCADFSIHPKYRSLGVALKLRRAAKEGVDAGVVDFLYAHPNEQMQVIHEKIGHSPVGLMVRYATVLKSRRWLEERLHNRIGVRMASLPLDLSIRLRDWMRRRRRTSHLEFHQDIRFDDRFDALFQRAIATCRVTGVRDTRYLSWRYLENPLYKSRAIVAQRDGLLDGYVLFTIEDHVAHVKDIFTSGDPSVVADLIQELMDQCQKLGLERMSMVVLEGHPVLDVATQFGFVRRPETSTMFCHAPHDSPLRQILLEKNHWYLTVGDRDV